MLNLHLLIHNVLSIFSIVLILGISLFTYLNGRKKLENVTAALLLFFAAIFTISHTIGVNIADPNISRIVFMFNLVIFIGSALQIHSVLAMVGQAGKQKWFIIFIYASAASIIIFFLFNPQLFLLQSVPKMYFPSYYVPGSMNILRLIFLNGIALTYSIYILLKAYHRSGDKTEGNQYLYWAVTMAVTYVIIFLPNFLVYDIEIDPIWGMLFAPLMLIPFLYGALRYGMLNVKIIAKQAFFFSFAVALVGGIITLFNYSNVWIQHFIPSFPLWVTAFISSILTVTLSIVIWQKLRKNDLMKYEFITTVTHKFRTPLTHIKWSAENISRERVSPIVREQLDTIVSANGKLVELTNLLVNAGEVEGNSYNYHMEKADLSSIVKEVIGSMTKQFETKQLIVIKDMSAGLYISCDISRIQFVLQTFIDNAINYTRAHGEITIKTYAKGKDAICSVTDTGIGIPKDVISSIFSKFYRGANARLEDTEGMGIGLFMSREIISRLHGKMWAESEGENRGSTFTFSIPLV